MPNSSPVPAADWGATFHPYQGIADTVVEEWDRCILGDVAVLPDHAEISGWHELLSMTYAVEQWFWDALILAWRAWPRAFTAETARTLGCEGYVYLSAIASPL